MAEQLDPTFFTKKHQRLYRWSTWVNYFSWVVLVYQVLHAIFLFFLFPSGENLPGLSYEFLLILTNPLSQVFSSISGILTGCFYWIVLRSIAAILNMILETDLNYREKTLGENNHG